MMTSVSTSPPKIHPLFPTDGQEPQLAQLLIDDPDAQLRRRMAGVRALEPNVERLLGEMRHMLLLNNRHLGLFTKPPVPLR